MAIKRFFPLVIIAAMFCSCVDNDRSMGEELITDDYKLNIEIRQFELPLKNKVSDSVQSFNKMNLLLGYFNDPVYGLKYSNCAAKILPYSDSINFGIEPKLTSAYINLQIDSVKLFNKELEGLRQNITIYKLTTDIDSIGQFCNSLTSDDYDPVPISKGNPVISGKGLLRINLTDAFANEFFNATSEKCKSTDSFFEKIKGIYITTDKPETGQTGGRFNFISPKSSILHINYILNDPERNIKDLDTTESFAIGYSKSYNFFSTNSKHLENDSPEDKLYIESLDGIKPFLDANTLRKILYDRWISKEKLENKIIIIANAKISLPYEMPDDYYNFNNEYPRMIYAFQNKLNTQDSIRFYSPIEDINIAINKGSINRSTMNYVLDITKYCQDLIEKKPEEIDENDNLWFAPMITSMDEYNNMFYYFDNRGYSKILLNGPTAERKPTLTITYSLLN